MCTCLLHHSCADHILLPVVPGWEITRKSQAYWLHSEVEKTILRKWSISIVPNKTTQMYPKGHSCSARKGSLSFYIARNHMYMLSFLFFLTTDGSIHTWSSGLHRERNLCSRIDQCKNLRKVCKILHWRCRVVFACLFPWLRCCPPVDDYINSGCFTI